MPPAPSVPPARPRAWVRWVAGRVARAGGRLPVEQRARADRRRRDADRLARHRQRTIDGQGVTTLTSCGAGTGLTMSGNGAAVRGIQILNFTGAAAAASASR